MPPFGFIDRSLIKKSRPVHGYVCKSLRGTVGAFRFDSVVINRHGVANELGIHPPQDFYGWHGSGPPANHFEKLCSVHLFVGKGVSDLDMIAAIANLCDVHFGHGDIINDPARELSVSEKAPPKSRLGRGTRDEACVRYESA